MSPRTATSAYRPTLWCETVPAIPTALDGLCRIGRLDLSGTLAEQEGSLLRTISDFPNGGLPAADSWLVPPGLGAHFQLINAIRQITDSPLIVSINGLGVNALRALRAGGMDKILLGYDARPLDWLLLTEQLAWFSAQKEAFAVTVANDQQAAMALLAGAAAVLIPADVVVDFNNLGRILGACQPTTTRPLSALELDALDSREACLTVKRPLERGATLCKDDLDITVADTLGLSPHLADRLVGLRILYPIVPGEPLHFAHFEDPSP